MSKEKGPEELEAEFKEFEEEFGAEFPEVPEPKKEEQKTIESGWDEIESPELNIWQPAGIGEKLIGKVLEIREGTYGTEAVLKAKGWEEPVITPAHKILQGKIEQLQEGDIVNITYMGQVKTGTGRKAESYRVLRRGGGQK